MKNTNSEASGCFSRLFGSKKRKSKVALNANLMYEIAYGLFASSDNESFSSYEIKNFIAYNTNQSTEGMDFFMKFKEVIRYFKEYDEKYCLFYSEEELREAFEEREISAKKTQEIIETNNRLKESNSYRFPKNSIKYLVEFSLKDMQEHTKLLQDQTVKKYYSIICGLWASVEEKRLFESFSVDAVKKYVKFHLDEAVEKDAVNTVYWHILDHGDAEVYLINKHIFGCTCELFFDTLKEVGKDYLHPIWEACDICAPRFSEKFKASYEEAIDSCKGNSSSFEAKLSSIESEYEENLSCRTIRKLIHDTTRELYLEGDERVRGILLNHANQYLWRNRMFGPLGKYAKKAQIFTERSQMQAALLAERVLHFHNHCGEKESYPVIEFPFKYNAESHIGSYEIYDKYGIPRSDLSFSNPFYSNRFLYDEYHGEYNDENHQPYYFPYANSEPYYMDQLCYDFVKWILASRKQEFNIDAEYIFNNLCDALKPDNEDIRIIEEERRKAENIEKLCGHCAYGRNCKLYGTREDCSSFLPK